jgi:hypothetical protein
MLAPKPCGFCTTDQKQVFRPSISFRARDIDWAQIDKSVETTLKKRPGVAKYRIVFACDLTDKGGSKGQGRTGWQSWDAHVGRWQEQDKVLGRSIAFEPITASDLVDWIAQPNAAGLARYWFGTDVLSLDWFSRQVRVAGVDLGERYTPQQHVVVTASLAFDGLARSRALKSRLHEAVKATWKFSIAANYPDCTWEVHVASYKAADALARVYSVEAELAAEPSIPWNTEQWIADVRQAQEALHAVEQLLREDKPVQASSEANAAARRGDSDRSYFAYCIRETDYALENLKRVLQSPALRCDASRVLVLLGEAGTGEVAPARSRSESVHS